MKQLQTIGKLHSTRLTEKAYKIVHKLAKVRDQSDTLTLEQIITDYVTLKTKENLK
jgi:predicted transcriptional regulator